MKKKTVIVLLFVVAGLTIGVFTLAERKLEITYPSFNLANAPTTVKTLLPDYLRYIFVFAIGISGFIIFGVMIMAGFRYFASSGNPTATQDAKKQIFSAFGGMTLLFLSYLILKTINPQLVTINVPSLGTETKAVVITSQFDREARLKVSNANLSDFGTTVPGGTDGGAVSLRLEHVTFDQVDIYVYSQANYAGTKQKITTQGVLPFRALSIEIGWKLKGVYLFSKENYQGDLRIFTASQDTLPDFNDKAQSISFIPGGTAPPEYGAVLFKDADRKGRCVIYNYDSDNLATPQVLVPGIGNKAASSITGVLISW